MRKATGSIRFARKIVDGLSNGLNHGVVVTGVITGDGENLPKSILKSSKISTKASARFSPVWFYAWVIAVLPLLIKYVRLRRHKAYGLARSMRRLRSVGLLHAPASQKYADECCQKLS